jgi:hypothetical protein
MHDLSNFSTFYTMTYLIEHLPFTSSSNHAIPPSGSHLLISDTITAPAYFAIYHLISAAVLDKRKVGEPFVTTSQGLTIRSYGWISKEKVEPT